MHFAGHPRIWTRPVLFTSSGLVGTSRIWTEAAATGDAGQIQQRRADLAVKYRLHYLTEMVPELKARYGLKLIGE